MANTSTWKTWQAKERTTLTEVTAGTGPNKPKKNPTYFQLCPQL